MASEDIIHRLNIQNQSTLLTPYLNICDDINKISNTCDIFTLRNVFINKKLLNSKLRPGLGVELLLSDLRKLKIGSIGKWVALVNDFYKLCILHKCQFIISSGSSSIEELVGGPSFDAILSICGISIEKYWKDLDTWLKGKLVIPL